jgi:preprotein translocase subunit SecF
MHDILIVISSLIFFSYQFDINIIAAFLIIIGYSLNDTIVVFDRIRENLEEYSKMKLYQIINLSLNETLSRTTITSLTTLFVLIALFLFGGSSLAGLSFALIIGIISGTYSSIFIATPIMMFLRVKYYKEENIKEE